MELSDDHQLVLACCWLNLKECALTTAAIVKTALKDLSYENAKDCGAILTSVLTRCRHKGLDLDSLFTFPL